MTVDERRRHYLQILGVEQWVPRKPSPRQFSAIAIEAQVAVESLTAPAPLELSAPRQSPKSAESETMPEQAQVSDDGAPMADRESRIAAMDWSELERAVAQCGACPLHASRTRPVFGVGNRQADWMIIGEAPGADEDRLGEPFVGRAGKLLDLMLKAMNLDREQVYITNILKSRPPNNRDPATTEMRACWPYLIRQLALIEPKLILAMGRIAAQSLLETQTPVGRLRGKAHTFAGRFPLVVTYHPAYLLRSPKQKGKSWDDLQLALQTMAANTDQ